MVRFRCFLLLASVAITISTTAVNLEAKDPMPTTNTPLHAAIAANDLAAVRAFVAANPHSIRSVPEATARPPLHLAADHDAQPVAAFLLEQGADFYARDPNGQLALDLPPGASMNETRKWLRQMNQSRNAFLDAVHKQQRDRVKELLAGDTSQAGARDIGDGWSAVMTACHHGDAELLRILLDAGATLDAVDFNSGHDAVFICAEKGRAECLKLLLAAGVRADRTWRVQYGSLPMEMNALHVAAWKGHAAVVELVLAARVDPNVRAKSYAMFSPLHFAATEGHAAIVQRLLDAGADPTARDGRRCITALEMALAGKHTAAAAALDR